MDEGVGEGDWREADHCCDEEDEAVEEREGADAEEKYEGEGGGAEVVGGAPGCGRDVLGVGEVFEGGEEAVVEGDLDLADGVDVVALKLVDTVEKAVRGDGKGGTGISDGCGGG